MKGDRRKLLLFIGSALAVALLLHALGPGADAAGPPPPRPPGAAGRFVRPR